MVNQKIKKSNVSSAEYEAAISQYITNLIESIIIQIWNPQ